ncbi:c-5 sterol desaturase [Penicillium ochrochloron]
MDVLLDVLDTFVFDRLYASVLPDTNAGSDAINLSLLNQHIKVYFPLEPSGWAEASLLKRDNMARQTLSLFLMIWFFGLAMYLIGSFIMYHTVYDKRLLKHPRYLPNQIKQEINQGLSAIPVMAILTAPLFLAEVRGWSKLYNFASEAPFPCYNWLQYPLFICFTDSGIYWIHRGLHHPLVYRWLHKPHHKWVVPTPFASYAFHPLDGWSQSLPYHIFPFLFPLQKVAYLGLFVFVTVWTVLIHDAEYLSTSAIINGAACHTMHHLYFNYNYGQYITIWDRLGGTYRKPEEDTFMQDQNHTVKIIDKED